MKQLIHNYYFSHPMNTKEVNACLRYTLLQIIIYQRIIGVGPHGITIIALPGAKHLTKLI